MLAALTLSAVAGWFAAFLGFGPRLAINHDELAFVHGALRLLADGRLEAYTHGPLLHELIALGEAGFYAWNRATGLVSGPVEHLALLVHDPHPHLVLGRSVSAMAALWLVIEVGRLGRAVGGRTVAACSMALCASNLTFIALTSVCKEEGLFWALSISSLRMAWAGDQPASSRSMIKAGVLLGAAAATKLFGILWSPILLLPLLRRHGDSGAARAQAATMAAVAVGSFLLLYPFVLTDTNAVIDSQRRMHSYAGSLVPSLAMNSYLTTHLPNLVGWPILIASVAEVGWRLWFERRGPVLLLLAPLGVLLFLGLRPGLSAAYYVFPLAILLCILAVAGAVRMGGKLPGRWRAVPVAALMFLALSDPAFLRGSIKHGLILFAEDARDVLRERIHEAVPRGSCIVIATAISGEDFFGPQLSPRAPPSGEGQFHVARRIALERSTAPRYELRIATSGDKEVEGCDWIVTVRFADPAEVGPVLVRPEAAIGWKMVAVVEALPDDRTILFPFLSMVEYRQLRAHSIADVASRRRLGWTLSLLNRAAAAPSERNSGAPSR